jgi:tryptophan synthase beta chain
MLDRPDAHGRFGDYGGRFVPETLIPALDELAEEFDRAWVSESFRAEFDNLLRDYVGRPTPLTEAPGLSRDCNLRVSIKREDLAHTGAHKINNAIGQCLLARRMGKRRIIAETGAGQHGVATATACALFGLDCEVYMGEEDCRRQELNVFRMKLLGARVIPVSSGTKTLKDALNEALRDWVTNVWTTHYVIGSVAGPHPYPYMVRQFQSVIGKEAREQYLSRHGRLPDACVACVGGGSNAIGFFAGFAETGAPAEGGEPRSRRSSRVRLIGVEAAGRGLESGEHAAPLTSGSPGVLHGAFSYLMQDEHGQVLPTHSVSAGLDYPGVGPEHAHLKDSGRAEYLAVTDREALDAFRRLALREGLICALESAHAFAALTCPGLFEPGSRVLVNMSGRGDKDMDTAAKLLGL